MINRIKGFKKNRFALASTVFLLVITLSAVLAPLIAPYSYYHQDVDRILTLPDTYHFMGTDQLGRDVLSRIIYGGRVSIAVGFISSLLALIFGTLYGGISGYIGGRLDNFLMRIVDIIYSLPDLLLIILINVVIGRGLVGIILAISLISWVSVARLIRGEVLRIKEETFIEAVRALGARKRRILFKHILPNAAGILIVTLTFRIPVAILVESSLSFVGLGITPPFSSWGTMANDGWIALRFYPHLIIFPGFIIFLTILAFNIIGDSLRDVLEVKD